MPGAGCRVDSELVRTPSFPSVVAVARRVRRVNSVVVPALFRRARGVTLICVNLCNLCMS